MCSAKRSKLVSRLVQLNRLVFITAICGSCMLYEILGHPIQDNIAFLMSANK